MKNASNYIAVSLLAVSVLLVYFFFFVSSENTHPNPTTPHTASGVALGEKSSKMLDGENMENMKNSEDLQTWNKVQREVIPPTFEVTAEKSYFYDHPNDEKPRKDGKVYVMRGDTVETNAEKSTDTMIFATYYNTNNNKTTEGYLKKHELKATGTHITRSELSEKWAKCVNVYDFIKYRDGELTTEQITGKVRIAFGWNYDGCVQQKSIPLNIDLFGRLDNFYKKSSTHIYNHNASYATGWGYGCEEEKPLTKKKTLTINGEKVELQGIDWDCWEPATRYLVSMRIHNINFNIPSSKNSLQNDFDIIVENVEKFLKIEHLPFTSDDAQRKKKEEKRKEEELHKMQQEEKDHEVKKFLSSNWTDSILSNAEFGKYGEYIRLISADDNYFRISTGLPYGGDDALDCTESWANNNSHWCSVDSIKNEFIYWSIHFRNYRSSPWTNDYEFYSKTQYRTNVKTEKTEQIDYKEKESCYIGDMAEGEEVPCYKVFEVE